MRVSQTHVMAEWVQLIIDTVLDNPEPDGSPFHPGVARHTVLFHLAATLT